MCSDEEVSFLEEELYLGQQEWDLSLISHAIGKRPFYGSLLLAIKIKKRWIFKGNLELLIMKGDFFFFLNFSTKKIPIRYGIIAPVF